MMLLRTLSRSQHSDADIVIQPADRTNQARRYQQARRTDPAGEEETRKRMGEIEELIARPRQRPTIAGMMPCPSRPRRARAVARAVPSFFGRVKSEMHFI